MFIVAPQKWLDIVIVSIFVISDFKILMIILIWNKISGGAYDIWQHLVTLICCDVCLELVWLIVDADPESGW